MKLTFSISIALSALAVASAVKSPIQEHVGHVEIAARHQFNYQAGLLVYVEDGEHWSGASIISNRWLISAAYILHGITIGLDAYLGAWNRTDNAEEGQLVMFVEAENVIVHENWQPGSYENDIALIELPTQIAFNAYVQPIKLPERYGRHKTYFQSLATVSGWGKTTKYETTVPKVLRFIELPIIHNRGCNLWYLGLIRSTQMCVRAMGGASSCIGDIGGPLVVNNDTLVGVFSYGKEFGCNQGFPVVYTRITSYLDWIEHHSSVVNWNYEQK